MTEGKDAKPTLGVTDPVDSERPRVLTADEFWGAASLYAPPEMRSDVPVAPINRPSGYGDISLDSDPDRVESVYDSTDVPGRIRDEVRELLADPSGDPQEHDPT